MSPSLPYFDEHGRCIPLGLSSPAHEKSRRWFLFNQPAVDYAAIYTRCAAHLPSTTPVIGAQEFTERALQLRQQLEADSALAPLTRGVGIPFLLPRIAENDPGTALEQHYVPAVAAAFKARFPEYDFYSHNTAHLAGNLTVAAGSRHEQLIAAARQGDVVGWYFPCLLEYSIPAAREVMQHLPECLFLAGGLDTCAALVGSPELLLRLEGYPPMIWLSALEGEAEHIGYHFEAYGYNLTFNRRAHLGKAAEYWASAVIAIG